jgi:N-dimethylarginine dimethylaminohydrolase
MSTKTMFPNGQQRLIQSPNGQHTLIQSPNGQQTLVKPQLYEKWLESNEPKPSVVQNIHVQLAITYYQSGVVIVW